MKSATKESKAKTNQRFRLGNTDTVKRGFLLAVVEFVKAKGTVDTPALIAAFSGNVKFDGKKVSASRVRRYVAYCKAHDIFKVAVKAARTSPVVKAAKGKGNLVDGAVLPRETPEKEGQ